MTTGCFYCDDLRDAEKGTKTALMCLLMSGRTHSYWCETQKRIIGGTNMETQGLTSGEMVLVMDLFTKSNLEQLKALLCTLNTRIAIREEHLRGRNQHGN